MKFGQVIEYSIKIELFFLKVNEENEAGRLVADLFFFFEKALYEVKTSGLELSFNIF